MTHLLNKPKKNHPLCWVSILATSCLLGSGGVMADQSPWNDHSSGKHSSDKPLSGPFKRVEWFSAERTVLPPPALPPEADFDEDLHFELLEEFMNSLTEFMNHMVIPEPESYGLPNDADVGGGSMDEYLADGLEDMAEDDSDMHMALLHDPVNEMVKIPENHARIVMGKLSETDTGRSLGLSIDGQMMMNSNDDTSEIFVHVTGLAPGTYGTHVHDLPCALGGGGHYKLDPTVSDTAQDNEIWPTVVVNELGVGKGFAQVSGPVRASAQSIVIHNAEGKRIACGDFENKLRGTVFSGEFSPVFNEAGQATCSTATFSGTAQLSRLDDQAVVKVFVSGLQPNTLLPAHVHEYRCEFNVGGGHYKHDPFAEGLQGEAITANEIWPSILTNAAGEGRVSVISDHAVRGNAQSIVIHDPSGQKMACANLDGAVLPMSVAVGQMLMTPEGYDRGVQIQGQAMVVRMPEHGTSVEFRGVMTAEVDAYGGFGSYSASLGTDHCAAGGGEPYSMNQAAGIDQGAVRMKLKRMNMGSGQVDVLVKQLSKDLAGPEVQSLLIYDEFDQAPIACADLVIR